MDADPKFDFSSIRTYAWLPDPPGMVGDPVLHPEAVDRRVRNIVNRELHELGYEKVAPSLADMHVTYYAGLETRVSWQLITRTYNYRAGWIERQSHEAMRREHDVGTLILDILEPDERRLVWRASANARLRSDAKSPQRRQQLSEALLRMTGNIPARVSN